MLGTPAASAAGAVIVRGMRVRAVNEREVSTATRDEVVALAKQVGDKIVLDVEYDPMG